MKPRAIVRWTVGGLLLSAVVALVGMKIWHKEEQQHNATVVAPATTQQCNTAVIIPTPTLETIKSVEFPVSVNYAAPIATLVEQGRYEQVNTLSPLDFKTDALAQYRNDAGIGKTVVTVTLIRFRDSSQDGHTTLSKARVHKALDELGLRAANLREFLEFGRQYPEELSKRRSITALGTRFESCAEGKLHGLGHICMNGSADGEMAFDDGSRALFILWGSPDENQKNIGDGWWFAAVPK